MKNIIKLLFALIPAMIFAQSSTINHSNQNIHALNNTKIEHRINKSTAEDDSTNQNSDEIKLYPNPITADKQFTVEYKVKESNFVKIDIFDTNGNLVQNILNGVKRNTGHNQETISVETLLNGKYEIKIQIGDEYKTKSFVIVR